MDLASIGQNVAVVEASAIRAPLDRTKPVIIRGAAATLQRQWTTERTLERFHGRRLKVAHHARSASSAHVMSLAEYLAYLDAPDDGELPPQYLMHGVDERDTAQELVSSLDLPDATDLVGGVSFFSSAQPIELFAEVAPVLRFAPSEGGAFDGGVGARWYFR